MIRAVARLQYRVASPINENHVAGFPFVNRPFNAFDASAQLRHRHAGGRVLLAEDNPVNRLVAEELVRSVGLVVDSANDGAQAVEMARLRPYALILMDVQMPNVDGLDAARAIRARAGASIPIIAMTGDDSPLDRAACRAAGMNDHVSKPVDPPELFAALLRWLAPAAADRGPRSP